MTISGQTPRQFSASRLRFQRVLSIFVISFISFVGLEALVYINNLYQQALYIRLSFYIYFFLIIWLYFLFDLHFKDQESGGTGFFRALRRRFYYFGNWNHFRHFQNFLILPGILYWGSIVAIGINFNHQKIQQFIAIVTALCLVICYSFFKEIFHTRQIPVRDNHFVILSYVKVYAAWVAYAASLGIVWYYCFPPATFYGMVFLASFMLLYQALFQFDAITLRSVAGVVAVSLIVSILSIFVFRYWNVNYFSAGVFLAAVYNFCWISLVHTIKKTWTQEVLLENIAILILIFVMVFGITNFKARIDRCI